MIVCLLKLIYLKIFTMKNSVVRLCINLMSSCILFVCVMGEHENSQSEKHTSDYLLDHIPVYATAIIALFVVQTVALIIMGQPCIPPSGLIFWYGNTEGPGNSQHITDWYTFTHILHGFLFYFITYGLGLLLPVLTVNFGYLIALSTAVTWEIVENTPCIINRYRETAVAAGYNGDSVINSFCDSIACTLGFWISHFSPWYAIFILAILEEIVLAIIIRDNLILNMIQIVFSLKCISDWQAAKTTIQPVSTTDNDTAKNSSTESA